MVDLVFVAHGRLAPEVKNSLMMVYGEIPNIHPVEFLANEGFDTVKGKIADLLPQLGGKVLILADLFGGTPYNAACAVAMETELDSQIEVISGLSLPLALEAEVLSTSDDLDLIKTQLLDMAPGIVRAFERVDDDDDDL